MRSFLEEAGVRAVRPPAKVAAVICDIIAEAIVQVILRYREVYERFSRALKYRVTAVVLVYEIEKFGEKKISMYRKNAVICVVKTGE